VHEPQLNPRSLLFTLYGDYVKPLAESSVPVQALVRIAEVLGVTSTALRTALSRMSAEGWLEAERVTGRPSYRLTAKGAELIREGTERIYERRPTWNGSWLVVCYSLSEGRRRERDRLRSELSFLGFGSLGNGIWISPHDLRHEVREILLRHSVTRDVAIVYGALDWPDDAEALVARAWDLAGLATRYAGFAARTEAALTEDDARIRRGDMDDRSAFCRRFMLTHEFRRFPFADPDLPGSLLPADWIGDRARRLFLDHNRLLKPGADRFFLAAVRNQRTRA
jgi:phenylacetic acid degradation operon negative regulatory protein